MKHNTTTYLLHFYRSAILWSHDHLYIIRFWITWGIKWCDVFIPKDMEYFLQECKQKGQMEVPCTLIENGCFYQSSLTCNCSKWDLSNSCNMGMALCMSKAWGIKAHISGKSQVHMLQMLCNTFMAIVTTPVVWMPQVIVTILCVVISKNC